MVDRLVRTMISSHDYVLRLSGTRGYAIRSDKISCAMILMDNGDHSTLDVPVMTMLKQLIGMYENPACTPQTKMLKEKAPASLYQILQQPSDPEKLNFIDVDTIVNHTTQAIQEVADRIGWIHSERESVQRSATHIVAIEAVLKELSKKVCFLRRDLSRAENSSELLGRLEILESEILETQERTTHLQKYMKELEKLDRTLKNSRRSSQDKIEDFNKLEKELNLHQISLAGRKVAEILDQFPVWISEKEAELNTIDRLVQGSDTQLKRINKELEETKRILLSSMEEVIWRGTKLDDLLVKSHALSESAATFYTQVRS